MNAGFLWIAGRGVQLAEAVETLRHADLAMAKPAIA